MQSGFLGIITNPYARINKLNSDYYNILVKTLGARGIIKNTCSVKELEIACYDFASNNIKYVGIVGGDGSISLVISYLYKAYGEQNLPQIIILRGGTINVLAANLKIKGLPHEILLKYLQYDDFSKLKLTYFNILKCKDKYGFLFASGAVANFLQEFYKNKGNMFSSFVFIIKVVLSCLMPFKKQTNLFKKIISQDELLVYTSPFLLDKSEYKLTTLLVSTLPKVPYGIYLFHKIKQNYAEILGITQTSYTLIILVIKILLDMRLNDKKNISQIIKTIEINSKNGFLCSLDGEVFTNKEKNVIIEIGTKLTFCLPMI